MPNSFGVFREYLKQPLRVPDIGVQVDDRVLESEHLEVGTGPNMVEGDSPARLQEALDPFHNISSLMLAHWFHNCGERMSRERLRSLVVEVLGSEHFSLTDVKGLNVTKLDIALDKFDVPSSGDGDGSGSNLHGGVGDGWIEEAVRIEVPTGVKQLSNPSAATASKPFNVPGLLRRPLVQVIKAACQEDAAQDFHFEPFKSFHTTPSHPSHPAPRSPFQRIHDELYSSDAWLEEQSKLNAQPNEPGCDLPKAIAAMMFWSDATHVPQFGQSKMWPVYLYFGNLSKWLRCKPRSRACHHVAHIPSLPDDIQDFIRDFTNGKSGSAELLRHCKRDLFHAVWERLLLDPEFLHAYRHGIVIKCADGIVRRVYPRIFTYSADYPEKVLVATIRDLGTCPCPFCLVTIDGIPQLGQAADQLTRVDKKRCESDKRIQNVGSARKIIYNSGYAPGNDRSDFFLKAESLVATENAFSKALFRDFGFDVLAMLVVDLMHEFELGVWKAVLIHIVRMLHCLGKDKVNEFNRRFRHVGNFGRSTVRSFAYMSVSEMKNWAARTYEDCLQCIIPCVEGLFPDPYNSDIIRLLHTLALWHGLAKLRQHTDMTLEYLDSVTRKLGKELRFFAAHVCPHFDAKETPQEAAARNRRILAKQKKGVSTVTASAAQPKIFNIKTIKIHLLGHYPTAIRRYGTTDSYSTQIGELEHRVVKSYYRRGNKRRSYVKSAVRMYRRGQLLHRAVDRLKDVGVTVGHKSHTVDRSSSVPLPPLQPDQHYQIAKSAKVWLHVTEFIKNNPHEPALKTFHCDLKDHLLGRLLNRDVPGQEISFSKVEREDLIIHNNLLYRHATLRVNYTTYNVQRDQDIIAPGAPSRSFIMIPAPDGDKPFWYARVLGIFHTKVIHRPAGVFQPVTVEFLWVRWLGEEPGYRGGFAQSALDRIGYVPNGPGAFGFLDPKCIIRAAHLIPAFEFGTTDEFLPQSAYWDTDDGDYESYYINPFVDRDMLTRYLDCGIGHGASFAKVKLDERNPGHQTALSPTGGKRQEARQKTIVVDDADDDSEVEIWSFDGGENDEGAVSESEMFGACSDGTRGDSDDEPDDEDSTSPPDPDDIVADSPAVEFEYGN